jgi:hypothetical protein
MGKGTPEKVQNMIDNIPKGRIAPVELIVRSSSSFWLLATKRKCSGPSL